MTAARPSERHTGPRTHLVGLGHRGHIAHTIRGTGRYWHTPVCDDCPWTGQTVQREQAAFNEWCDHHTKTTPTNPLMPEPIRPTEPAEQPALF